MSPFYCRLFFDTELVEVPLDVHGVLPGVAHVRSFEATEYWKIPEWTEVIAVVEAPDIAQLARQLAPEGWEVLADGSWMLSAAWRRGFAGSPRRAFSLAVRRLGEEGGRAAPQAAGVIHSDFERGFIKAEVYTIADLEEYGNEAGLNASGKLRVEGKAYVVKDGDLMHFRFDV